MQRNRLGAAALLAGLALGAGACEGGNSFPDDPLGAGDATVGSIRGQVTANGAGLSGAQIAVVNGPSTLTGADGEYRISGLAPGSYRISLLAPVGFLPAPGDSTTRTAVVSARSTVVVSWRLQGTAGGGGTGGTGTGTGTGGTTGGTGTGGTGTGGTGTGGG